MSEVSIILAVLNGAKTVGKAIQSAQSQTVKDIEIIVVDDGSIDETPALVASMAAADGRIKLIKMPQNVGVSGARNAALAAATGAWVTILDADDWYESNRLEVLLKAARDSQADLVADNLKIYDHARGAVIMQTHHGRGGAVTALTPQIFFNGDNPLRRHPMGFIKPLVSREFLTRHKIAYDPGYRVGEDYIFVAEILLHNARAVIIPDAYYVYVHRISPTTRKVSCSSHSEVASVFALMMTGCDKLLQRYGAGMGDTARHALERRRWVFSQADKYQDMRDAVRSRHLGRAIGIALLHPLIFVMIGNIVLGVVAARSARLRLIVLST